MSTEATKVQESQAADTTNLQGQLSDAQHKTRLQIRFAMDLLDEGMCSDILNRLGIASGLRTALSSAPVVTLDFNTNRFFSMRATMSIHAHDVPRMIVGAMLKIDGEDRELFDLLHGSSRPFITGHSELFHLNPHGLL